MARHDLVILIDALRTYKPEASDAPAVERMYYALTACYNEKRPQALRDLFALTLPHNPMTWELDTQTGELK